MEIRKTEFQLSQELFSPPFSQLTCVNVCHKLFIFKIKGLGDFPGGPVVKTPLTLKGVWVQSLVGERRSCHSLVACRKLKGWIG